MVSLLVGVSNSQRHLSFGVAFAMLVLLPSGLATTSCGAQDAIQERAVKPVVKQADKAARRRSAQNGVTRTFAIDPRWEGCRFPDNAVYLKSPAEIAAVFSETKDGKWPVASYEKPTDDSLRIVGTGHSFMAPGYQTLPSIAKAAGLKQPTPITHTGGGMTGSARYKWEQENGIFQFDGKPKPILLNAIANAKWDAMMWGPYYNDREEYYSCWIDFCLKYNPDMKFYLSDAWPQLEQLSSKPSSESQLTGQVMQKLHQEKRATFLKHFNQLRQRYEDRIFVLPTSQAMVIAVDYFHRSELPGVEGIHKVVGGKERSLWRDQLGHLGRGMESLEGYVFYATLYGRSPELIEDSLAKPGSYPSPELDRVFRKIAWEAAITDPLSGVVDKDGDKIADDK
ncbi:MAG: hypothetical protein WBD20_21720 [Pirellulaceae bacterium]